MAEYDGFAAVYDRFWGGWVEDILPDLDRMGLSSIPNGARLLDLCCGTGRLAARLADRGHDVVGIDASEDMIAVAAERHPHLDFRVGDARTFTVDGTFAAVTSTYDALNHILDLDALGEVFARVFGVLDPGGLFLFDLNLEEGYTARWWGSFGSVADDVVLVGRPSYDRDTKSAVLDLTIMELDSGTWQRRDIRMTQTAYEPGPVVDRLSASGFDPVVTFDVAENLGWSSTGRVFFAARKPEGAR